MSDEIRELEAQLARVNAGIARLQWQAAPLRNRLTALYAERYARENPPVQQPERKVHVRPSRRSRGPRKLYRHGEQ